MNIPTCIHLCGFGNVWSNGVTWANGVCFQMWIDAAELLSIVSLFTLASDKLFPYPTSMEYNQTFCIANVISKKLLSHWGILS